jgi:hypothetical protein
MSGQVENFMKNIKWISIPLEDIARQYNYTIAYIKEKITEKGIPLMEQGTREAIAKKYLNELIG